MRKTLWALACLRTRMRMVSECGMWHVIRGRLAARGGGVPFASPTRETRSKTCTAHSQNGERLLKSRVVPVLANLYK